MHSVRAGQDSVAATPEMAAVRLGLSRTADHSVILTRRAVSMACALIGSALVMWAFYDRYWYVVDEGIYAHMAERLLAGEVLNRQVQSLHPGYINFVNAAAFATFGLDFVSLRYPLVVITIIQASLVWSLFASRNLWMAVVASLAMTVFGVIHFLNPAAHWYALFLTVALIAWLWWISPENPYRIPGAGVLLGAICLFRLLTGVWVASALLVIMLREKSDGARGWNAALSRGVVLVLIALLLAYLALTGDVDAGGIVLLAAGPLAILCVALYHVRASTRQVVQVLGQLTVGSIVTAAPLIAYHVTHGSIEPWLRDTFFTSVVVAGRRLYENGSFAVYPAAGLLQVLAFTSTASVANGLYWLILPLLPLVNAIVTLRAFSREDDQLALPIVATFYSLVTLHLAGAVYLYFSVALSIVSILWHVSRHGTRWSAWCAQAVTIGLMVVAIVFQAAQSSFRTPMELARGDRTVTRTTPMCAPFSRSALRVTEAECAPYRQMVEAIQAEAPSGASILALPSDAELYFLSGRRNPLRFYNSAVGLQTSEDVAAVLQTLKLDPPRVVTYRPDDKYNTDATREVMEHVRSAYDHFDTIAGVELYRVRGDGRID